MCIAKVDGGAEMCVCILQWVSYTCQSNYLCIMDNVIMPWRNTKIGKANRRWMGIKLNVVSETLGSAIAVYLECNLCTYFRMASC